MDERLEGLLNPDTTDPAELRRLQAYANHVAEQLRAAAAMFGAGAEFYEMLRARSGGVAGAARDEAWAKVVISLVAVEYGVTFADVIGARRHKQLLRARHAAMSLIRLNSDLSYPQIARIFDRDHNTVINGVRRAEALLATDEGFAAKYRGLEVLIRGEPSGHNPNDDVQSDD